MLVQIKRGKVSDKELSYLHDCLQDAELALCKCHMEMVNGQGVCPCEAQCVCRALLSSIRYIEKQLPSIYSPDK